jgi:hypothetical protein
MALLALRRMALEVASFMSTRDGVALAKAFMQIGNVHIRRRIVDLVEQIQLNQD